ncbi:MAG: hypothetical protein ABI175_11245 [Polyangiales bacterium]
MAKSKKGARNIVVGDVKYRWRATGNDGYMVPMGLGRYAITRQIVVTNRIVRRVIEHAVRDHVYDPRMKAKPLALRSVDEAIDVSDAIRSA